LTVKTHVVQRVSIVSGRAPKGFPAGSNQIASIIETDRTKLETHSSTTIAYMQHQSPQDLLYGSSTRIAAPGGAQSSTSTTIYSVPRIVAKPPGEKWTNSAARRVDEHYSDGHDENRAYAADGTYVEKGTAFDSNGKLAPTALEDRSSGAGSYSGPFLGCPPDTTFVLTAPSGKPPAISLGLTSPDKYCSVSAGSFPAWFAVNPVFYEETDSSTQTSVPSSCSASQGRPATDIRSQIHFLDTVVGYFEVTQSDSYAISGSIACVTYSDTMSIYYDYQGDTPYTVLTPRKAKPIATTVTQETLQGSEGRETLPAFASGALERHFVATLERQREQMHAALIQHCMEAQGGSR
jgi:hypothetical protein